MSTLPVIPTPLSQRWKEFRIQVVPVLVFIALVAIVAVTWKQYLFQSTLVGKVQVIQSPISSPKAGIITKVFVERFQQVKAGDPIAEIMTIDTNILAASIALIRAETAELQTSLSPVFAAQKNGLSYDQLRLDALRRRVDLATAKADMQQAESEYQRQVRLHQEKIASDYELELAQRHRDSKQAQITELEKLLVEMNDTLKRTGEILTQAGDPKTQMQAAIAVQEARLKVTEAEMKPLILRAPFDAIVIFVSCYAGETATPGDQIVNISALSSHNIIGYLRQPLTLQPKVNMAVRVRTRSYERLIGMGKIIAVGHQMQSINDYLLPPTKYDITEQGLPVLVSLPDEFKTRPGEPLKVHPGEMLDMMILPDQK